MNRNTTGKYVYSDLKKTKETEDKTEIINTYRKVFKFIFLIKLIQKYKSIEMKSIMKESLRWIVA
tara:strand:+ start:331 stop:525 length:195 start_codon:yes stop_codon:yes gene_type:complete